MGVDLFRFMESFQKTAVGDSIVVPANALDRCVPECLPCCPMRRPIPLMHACKPVYVAAAGLIWLLAVREGPQR